ncbi:MAG: hypothetical protein IT371_29150 [Deltaproteobacteria bacterium]|nr:hypothetical protein [Deltaproteobacteria bacterium]
MSPGKASGILTWGRPVREGGLILVALGAALALGGGHRATIAVFSILAALLVGLLWAYRRAKHARLTVPWYGAVLLGVFAFTALQLVPLPMALVRLLSPATAEMLGVSLSGVGGGGGWHALSLDPTATSWELLKIGAAAMAFILAHNSLHRSQYRRRLLIAFVVTGVVLAFVGFLGAIVAPGRPLLFYTPAGGGGGLITTSFVNANHGGAFLTICSLAALGLAISAGSVQTRTLLLLSSIFLGAAVCMTLSRGAMGALAVGFFVLGTLVLSRPRLNEPKNPAVIALVPLSLALTIGLAAWLGHDTLVDEFLPQHVDIGKVALWPAGVGMLRANLLVGVGRGAFMYAFPHYFAGGMPADVTYSHLENQYLHLPIELGLPVGGAVILASAVAWVLWLRKVRQDPALCAIVAALAALALHSIVDFGLEMLGLMLPAAVLAGALSAGANAKRRDAKAATPSALRTRLRNVGAWAGPVAAGLLLLATLATSAASGPSADAEVAQAVRLTTERAAPDRVYAVLEKAIRRHPADWVPHSIGARLAVSQQDRQAVRWLNRALYLYPRSPALHLDAARFLRRTGKRRQALLEYALALKYGAARTELFGQALPLCKNADEVQAVLPEQPEVHAAAVTWLTDHGRVALAREHVSLAQARWPDDADLARAEIRVLIGGREYAQARTKAEALAAKRPSAEHYLLWAKASADQPGAELQLLLRAQYRYPDDVSLSFALAGTYMGLKQYDRARAAAERIVKQSTVPSTLAYAHDLLAKIHWADGRPHRAKYEEDVARRLRMTR